MGRFPPVAIALVGSLLVVVFQPLAQVLLQFFHRIVEGRPHPGAEELVEDGAVEPLDVAVGPRTLHFCGAVFDVVESQVESIGTVYN